MTIVSSSLTFPNIGWWMQVVHADKLLTDTGEHFQKMSYRNRYRVGGSNNSILLTVPLTNGRDQHIPVKDVLIHNKENWQVQHWRTLTSVYRRSPYFEHYEGMLQRLFETRYELLADLNRDALQWVMAQLRLKTELTATEIYEKEYPNEVQDIRNVKAGSVVHPKYYQVFEDRTGFLPNLSILDLLFSEGPAAMNILKG